MSFKVGDEVYIRSKSVGRKLAYVKKNMDISGKKVISEKVVRKFIKKEYPEIYYVICEDYYLSTDLVLADNLLPDELFEI